LNTSPRAVVIVPTYNERENIGPLVERVDSVRKRMKDLDLELLFVDDSSPDGTGDAIAEAARAHPFVHLLVRSTKQGIGRAFIDGFAFAIEHFDPSVVVQIDSDLQHPPELIPELVRVVLEGADVALASRNVAGGRKVGWSRSRRLTSWGANWLARIVLGLDQKDAMSGFKAYSREMVEELTLRKIVASTFSYQAETLLIARMAKMRVEEVPFTFVARRAGKSKLKMKDIVRFLWEILAIQTSHPPIKRKVG